MKACVTGATGFVGAHVTKGLAEQGDEVRVTYRNPDRLSALSGVDYRQAKADVLTGSPYPLGASWDGEGVNFALYSEHADAVDLCLFGPDGSERQLRMLERTGFEIRERRLSRSRTYASYPCVRR